MISPETLARRRGAMRLWERRDFRNGRCVAEIFARTGRQYPVNAKDQIESPGQEHFPKLPLALRLQDEGGVTPASHCDGKWNVVETADIAGLSRPSADDGADKRMPAAEVSTENSPRAGFTAL